MAAGVLFVSLAAIYVIAYYLNRKTDIPEECIDLVVTSEKCMSCSVAGCSSRPKNEVK